MFNNTTPYGYACDARQALMQHVTRNTSTKTPAQTAHLVLVARRVALLAGRPVAPPQQDQD